MLKQTNLKPRLALVPSRSESTPTPRKSAAHSLQVVGGKSDVPNFSTFMPNDLKKMVSDGFFMRNESVARVAAKVRIGRNAVEDVIRATTFERESLWQLRYRKLWERHNGSLPPAPGAVPVLVKRAA